MKPKLVTIDNVVYQILVDAIYLDGIHTMVVPAICRGANVDDHTKLVILNTENESND